MTKHLVRGIILLDYAVSWLQMVDSGQTVQRLLMLLIILLVSFIEKLNFFFKFQIYFWNCMDWPIFFPYVVPQ